MKMKSATPQMFLIGMVVVILIVYLSLTSTGTKPISSNTNEREPTYNYQPPPQTQQSTSRNDGLAQCKLRDPVVPEWLTKVIKIPPRPTHFAKTCKQIATDLQDVKPPTVDGPREIPKELYDQYTFNRTIPVNYQYMFQKYAGGAAETPVWTIEQINNMRDRARKRDAYGNYPHDCPYIYATLDRWGMDFLWGKKGIVLGSENPWAEAILLEYGASEIITIEYGKISSLHPQIFTMLPSQNYKKLIEDEWEPVDWAFSFSSIEHSGLGRYGDPLNPFGDFEAMEQISCALKPGGILFLGIPVAADYLVFNLHRIYGPTRLAKIFEGWRVIDIYGVQEGDFQSQGRADNQPVIVLQNYRGCAH